MEQKIQDENPLMRNPECLADINDQMADIEEGGSGPANVRWIGHASKELKQASRKAAS
ncbi:MULTISPECIES: hypothetical protein [unclassified Fibrobacter]|uniref:hypothetical protein n=1 Tax=unclassified Fibrobacter TaxID=2634177 RepID=UPI000D79358A|nr:MULTISPECIES: hypothetical protein [unclassified Fibrobacter]PWJ68277.1 hypothetical protein BGX12_1082 [Fibrobacter sp. UWR4]PZW65611.1 hypothetical protein C8E88_10302 [Fibrobacter sp. UWR1]